MKLANFGWIMGGVVAIGLGMVAEACSSSSQGSTNIGDGGTNSSSTASCAALTACCTSLMGNATDYSQCDAQLKAGNCGYLATIQQNGLCLATASSGASTGGTPASTGGNNSTGVGPSSTSPGNTGNTTGGGNTSTSQGESDTSGAATCPKLFAETKQGDMYCPFSGVDGGKAQYCGTGDVCCEPEENDAGVAPPSTCGSKTSCTANATVWECLEAIDCTGNANGTVCCASGTVEAETCTAADGGTSTYNKIKDFKGTTCSTSCGAGSIVCEAAGDCPSGQTCVPSKAYGNDFGVCVSN
jgi:hypothetical protein